MIRRQGMVTLHSIGSTSGHISMIPFMAVMLWAPQFLIVKLSWVALAHCKIYMLTS